MLTYPLTIFLLGSEIQGQEYGIVISKLSELSSCCVQVGLNILHTQELSHGLACGSFFRSLCCDHNESLYAFMLVTPHSFGSIKAFVSVLWYTGGHVANQCP